MQVVKLVTRVRTTITHRDIPGKKAKSLILERTSLVQGHLIIYQVQLNQ